MFFVSAAATMLATVISAHAELGGAPTWLGNSASQSTMLVEHRSAASVGYTVNETTLASGTVVREYVAQDGTVFAVVWRGPQMAPLNTLLGSYFQTYLQGLSAVQTARGRAYGPATVQQTGLIVQTGGHMGAFTGRAYLPLALPQGTSSDDLR